MPDKKKGTLTVSLGTFTTLLFDKKKPLEVMVYYYSWPPGQGKVSGICANLEKENVLTALLKPALSITWPTTGSADTSFLAKSR